MKVKMLVSMAGPEKSLSPGDFHTCSKEEAGRLIAEGYAEPVELTKAEKAAAEKAAAEKAAAEKAAAEKAVEPAATTPEADAVPPVETAVEAPPAEIA